MRFVFIGTVKFSKSCLEKLIALKADVFAVCKLKESSFNADHIDLFPRSEKTLFALTALRTSQSDFEAAESFELV